VLIAEDDLQVLAAPSRLDVETRLAFRQAVLAHLERAVEQGEARVILDLRHTSAIDANGLGILVLLQKRARAQGLATRLLHAPPVVTELLQLTKLIHLFELEP